MKKQQEEAEAGFRRQLEEMRRQLDDQAGKREAILRRVRGVLDKLSGKFLFACRLGLPSFCLVSSCFYDDLFHISVPAGHPVDTLVGGEDAVLTGLEACSDGALELLGRATATLTAIAEKVLPEDRSVPTALPALLESFTPCDALLDDFSQVQTKSGAEAVLMLSMGHGVPVDYERITGERPRDAQGNEVDLSVFAPDAERLAERVFRMLAEDSAIL